MKTSSKKTGRGLALRAGHDPRSAALLALGRVLLEGRDSQEALDSVLQGAQMVPSDRALCTELVYGCLRLFLRLRWFLGRFLRDPEKLPDELRLALILCAYESAHLRIPAHAGVDWAVSHVRNRFGQGLAGLANGVLRNFQRGLAEYRDPDFYAKNAAGPRQALALRYAIPEWILALWLEAYGEAAALDWLEAGIHPAPPGLRVNRLRPDWRDLRAEILSQPEALPVGQAGAALGPKTRLPLAEWIRQGRVSRQSPAAYESLFSLRPEDWGQPIWDACAGRGGKTLALLEAGVGVSLASDFSQQRARALAEDLRRIGLPESDWPGIVRADAANPPLAAKTGGFAGILVDAPCSGLGTLARRPEIRLRRIREDVERLALTQGKILERAAELLAPGGRIIYLTCTISPAENEDLVKKFLESRRSFSLDEQWVTPPDSPWREFFFGVILKKT